MLSDEQWPDLEPLIEACLPHAKVPSAHLRRTVEAILLRHQKRGEVAIPAGRVRAVVDGGADLLKEWRAVATRYEKTAASFLGVLCLAATLDWFKR